MTRPSIPPASPAAAAGLFVVLLVVLFVPTFGKLLNTWAGDLSYSHGYLMLPLAMGLGIRRYWRAGPPNLSEGNLPRALAAVVIGAFFHGVAVLLAWSLVDWLALIFLIRALLIAMGGGNWAAQFNVPLLFLFFMFPLPLAWTTYLAVWLQDIVAQLSTAMLEPFFLVVRVGKSISIEGVDKPLIVAHECSGVRQLIMFSAVGVFLGEWSMRPWWARLLLLVAALPVSILANSLRVMMMAMGSAWFGLGWINTGLHDLPAYLSVPLGCLLYLGVHLLIGRFVKTETTAVSGIPDSTTATDNAASARVRNTPCWAATVAMGCVLLMTYGLKWHLSTLGPDTYASMRAPLNQLPEVFTIAGQPWHGRTSPGERELAAKVDFQVDDMMLREFAGPPGGSFAVYAVYSRTAGDRYHHPEHCIRDAAGGTELLGARRRVPLGNGREAQFMRFQVGYGKTTSVYYWHYTFLPPADKSVTLLQAIHRSVGRVPPSLTLEIFTDQTDPAFFAALEKDVLPRIDAQLYENHLPESAKCGCQRFPVVILRY
jgi:exosortase